MVIIMSAMLQSGWSTEDDLMVKEKLYTYFNENEYWFKVRVVE